MTLAFRTTFVIINKIINMRPCKIDNSYLKTYNIFSVRFYFLDNLRKIRFFEDTFLLAETNMKMAVGIFFLFFTKTDVEFDAREPTWRIYIIAEIILTTK